MFKSRRCWVCFYCFSRRLEFQFPPIEWSSNPFATINQYWRTSGKQYILWSRRWRFSLSVCKRRYSHWRRWIRFAAMQSSQNYWRCVYINSWTMRLPNDHYIIELTGRVKFERAIRLFGVRFTISSAVILNISTDSFSVCLSTLLSWSTSYCIVLYCVVNSIFDDDMVHWPWLSMPQDLGPLEVFFFFFLSQLYLYLYLVYLYLFVVYNKITFFGWAPPMGSRVPFTSLPFWAFCYIFPNRAV